MKKKNISISELKIEDGKITSGTMYVPMTISQGECKGTYEYELEVDLADVDVEQLLPYAGAALRIRVQTIREKGDVVVKEYIKTTKRKFHDIIARQRVERVKLETADDFVKHLDKLSGSELAKLKELLNKK